MYGDNDLVYSNNRTSIEKFTRSDFCNYANKFEILIKINYMWWIK